jgi:hypothetical protein
MFAVRVQGVVVHTARCTASSPETISRRTLPIDSDFESTLNVT